MSSNWHLAKAQGFALFGSSLSMKTGDNNGFIIIAVPRVEDIITIM